MKAAQAQRDLQKMGDAGYDTSDPELDKVFIEMTRYESDLSSDKFLETVKKFSNRAGKLPMEIFNTARENK